jgi:3-oxoacyl-[acyl-carrier protein] reductase
MALYPDLGGRVALVTGGGRGIGKAIALTLAEAGADVAVNYRSRADAAEATAAEIRRSGRRAAAVRADVSIAAEVQALVEEVEKSLGSMDILVNNAGISEPCGVEDLTEALFERTLAVNLKSAFLCTQAVLPGMRARGFGRIVNISSGAARGAGAVGVHYNASKAGMEGLTRGYAARVVKDGVTVNAVAPSLIATEMIKPHRLDNLPKIPLGRLGTVEEIASIVLMVVGNPYMTGQTVAANGGMHFN